MAYKVWSVSTTSWGDKAAVDPASCGWASALNQGKDVQATFKLGEPGVSIDVKAGLLEPLKRALVVEWDGTPVYGGVILKHSYSRDTQTLTTPLADAMWWVLRRRHLLASRGSDAAARNIEWRNLTYGTLVKRAIQQAQAGGPEYALPIVVPADDAGVHSETLYGYHMPIAAELIEDITAKDMGPDVSFRPRWTAAGTIEWVRLSDPFDQSTYPVYELHVSAPESGITNLRSETDASNVTNRLFGLGEGTEKNMLVEPVADTTSRYLPLERSVAFKQESDRGRLRSLAQAELSTTNAPTVQVSMDLPADGTPNAAQIRLNGMVRWIATDDPYLSPTWNEARVIELSGNTSTNRIHVELQPLGG